MPQFVRFNYALNYTLDYYKIGRIRDHLLRDAQKDNFSPGTSQLLDTYVESVFQHHKWFEEEIHDAIEGFTANRQLIFFQQLKDWLSDWRIRSVERGIIEQLIFEYNKQVNEEFEYKISNKVAEFRSHPDFEKGHKTEIEYTTGGSFGFGTFGFSSPTKKLKKINYQYYCIEEIPELIDTYYLNDYLTLLNSIVGNLRNIITKYVELYFSGQIKSNSTIISDTRHQSIFWEQQQVPLLEAPKPTEPVKVKTNLSVKELACLFRILSDYELISADNKQELFRTISATFKTKRSEDISTNNLTQDFSDPDPKAISFWREQFRDMVSNISNKLKKS